MSEIKIGVHDLYPDRTPEQREIESRAHGFTPDPGFERALAAKAKDPAAWEAEMRRMRASQLEVALYASSRDAAIKLGTFVPPTDGGDA